MSTSHHSMSSCESWFREGAGGCNEPCSYDGEQTIPGRGRRGRGAPRLGRPMVDNASPETLVRLQELEAHPDAGESRRKALPSKESPDL
jgi:hypothetical protein